MKQSSIEPPKKKLKQARLPFQILSPGIKSTNVTTPQKNKRKASEAQSDDDVEICEVTEVKENQIKPVEKKPKIVNSDSDKEIVNIKNVENETKIEEESVEVKDGNSLEDDKSVGADIGDKKKKSNSTITSDISRKKSKTPLSNRKGGKTGKTKCGDNVNNSTSTKTDSTENEVLPFVDLSDSPCKTDSQGEKSSKSITVPKLKCNKSPINKKEKDQKEVDLSKKNVQEEEKQENTTEINSVEDGQDTEDKDCSKREHSNLVSLDLNTNSQKAGKRNENEGKEVKDVNVVSEREESKCLFNVEVDKKSLPGVSSKNKGKNYSNLVKNMVEQDNLNEKLTPHREKKHIKQSSLIDIVTKKSPKTISSDSGSLNSIKLDVEKGNCDKESNEDIALKNEISTDDSSFDPKRSPLKDSLKSVDESLTKTPTSDNESLSEHDISISSECSTPASTSGTPGLPKEALNKSLLVTPRRITPKQLKKLKEKEDKIKEKERLKQEREKKKAEEREEKERQKKEKEEEKLKLKQEKEEEKRKEREEKERKKQAEIDQKNEEKRLKEEQKQTEKRLKEEEKKAKEEEKRKKEEEEKKKKEEKRIKEEQKEAEKRKSAQAFASFFVKSEMKTVSPDEEKENTPDEYNFQPFEVKNDMRLAPLIRVELSEERKKVLDTVIESGTWNLEQRLYLEEVHSPSYTKRVATKTWPAPDGTDDDVMIIESEKPNEEMETDCTTAEKKSKKHHRAKLLQFHENRRPPYWGTWRKKSKFIRPRAPLNLDKTMFEYDIDSDDEWEEPEDGESLRGSEDEESQDEQYEEDNDMFVPHGYLSDEEGQEDLDDKSPEAMKAKLKFLQMEFEAERNEKQEKLKPRLIGCVWFCNSESDSSVGSHIAELFLSRRAVWEGSLPVTIAAPPLPSSPYTPQETADTEEPRSVGPKKKVVHESMIPHIIKKVHGSRRKLSALLVELLEELVKEPGLKPSKRCLADKIREIALWTRNTEIGHHCWCVKEEIRQAHNLMDLNIIPSTPSPPASLPPSTNITKFTKVLTSDERLKLLREVPTGNSSSKVTPKTAPASKPTTPSIKLAKPSTSNKLFTPGKSSSSVKKRVPLVSSVTPGKQTPKQNPKSIMNFVHTTTKPSQCEKNAQTPSTETENSQELAKADKKVKKRITPITLTTSVSKPASTPSQEECIVLSD